MIKRLSIYIIAFCFICLGQKVTAKHIVGGEMTYECIKLNEVTNQVTFKITMTIYRDPTDPTAARFDNPANIGIYRGNGTSWRHLQTMSISYKNIEDLRPDTGIPCLSVPKGLRVEKGVYEFEVILDIIPNESYLIAYQRCCRNNTINNILYPGDQGALYSVEITPEAQRSCDNSPIYNDFPPIVICAGEELRFDHSATDMDGQDSLVYSFCAPITAGGTAGSTSPGNASDCNGISPDPANCPPLFRRVEFIAPYSEDHPMGGNPIVSIDPETGIISGTPDILGQFVVSVCVDSYRDGQLISKVNRDFQFNVAVCEPLVTADIVSDSIVGAQKYNIISCGVTTVDMINKSTKEENIDSYTWSFPVGIGDTLKYYTRDVSVMFPDTGLYQGRLILNTESPFKNCRDTAFIDVNIYPSITADFKLDYDSCSLTPLKLMDLSISEDSKGIKEWKWFINDNVFSYDSSPTYSVETVGSQEIELHVLDYNGCQDFHAIQFEYYPLPPQIHIEPNKFIGCAPEEIQFNLSGLLDSTYNIQWDFGDAGLYEGLSAKVLFEEPGRYSSNVSIVSLNGCRDSTSFRDIINMRPGPIADFTYSPEDPDPFNNIVDFRDNSTDAVDWHWFIGDDVIYAKDHSYIFRDTGYYEVIEVVTSANNCVDTARAYIDIVPLATYFMPDAFTPNDDDLNDGFRGKGYTDGFKTFQMQIYNRWGELVYESDNPVEAWNGRIRNKGKECPSGTYVYKVIYETYRNEERTLKGHLNLIR